MKDIPIAQNRMALEGNTQRGENLSIHTSSKWSVDALLIQPEVSEGCQIIHAKSCSAFAYSNKMVLFKSLHT